MALADPGGDAPEVPRVVGRYRVGTRRVGTGRCMVHGRVYLAGCICLGQTYYWPGPTDYGPGLARLTTGLAWLLSGYWPDLATFRVLAWPDYCLGTWPVYDLGTWPVYCLSTWPVYCLGTWPGLAVGKLVVSSQNSSQ